jgi:hypothetical protein
MTKIGDHAHAQKLIDRWLDLDWKWWNLENYQTEQVKQLKEQCQQSYDDLAEWLVDNAQELINPWTPIEQAIDYEFNQFETYLLFKPAAHGVPVHPYQVSNPDFIWSGNAQQAGYTMFCGIRGPQQIHED